MSTIHFSQQVIGRREKENVQSLKMNNDYKMKLNFLIDDERQHYYIKDLTDLRNSAYIFPPLKTYNGIPEV